MPTFPPQSCSLLAACFLRHQRNQTQHKRYRPVGRCRWFVSEPRPSIAAPNGFFIMPPHIPESEDDVIVLQRSDSSESALPADPDSTNKQQQLSPSVSRQNNGQYTVEEVARHNKKDDAWLIYNNQVLDISKWVSISCLSRCRRFIIVFFPSHNNSFIHSMII